MAKGPTCPACFRKHEFADCPLRDDMSPVMLAAFEAKARDEATITVHVEYTDEWREKLTHINDACSEAIENYNASADPYHRGIANGLILAVAKLVGKKPILIEETE